MHRIAFGLDSKPLPLHRVAATGRFEEEAKSAVAEHTLMRLAGARIARLARALAPHAQRVWIAAGPGNNGGDGLEAARCLHLAGVDVSVSLHAAPDRLPLDAADALERARDAGVAITPAPSTALRANDLAIDALLGIGANRAPAGSLAAAISQLNTLPCPVLAVDVPSGLCADSGQPLGDTCVTAQHTLTLLTLKPGLFTGAGRDHAGSVWFDTLDVAVDADSPDAWLAGAPALAVRRHSQHKGSFGDVGVVAGAPGMTGAALLAARAASAAGAGRVHVELLDGGSLTHDALRPELMFRPGWSQSDPAALGRSTALCGCGGGSAVREVLPRLLGRVPRLVLDADALNAIAGDTALQRLLRARVDRGLHTVLTPHPLEAARLLATTTAAVQADRLSAAVRLAESKRCIVVLKGSGSVVAAPGRLPSINPTGNAALASAGTGDVLAGWLAGLWSSQAGPDGASTAWDSALAAVCIHGRAAELAQRTPLRASELIEHMHDVQSRLAAAAGAAGCG